MKKILLQKIRIKRITDGYSQQYMAQHLKITQSQYSRLENGVNMMSNQQIIQVFEILKMDNADSQSI